jgi:lycopene beta-cyclase
MPLNTPLVIVGGGLAGSLAALSLAERQPALPLLLLEAGPSFGGNHTWSFFDTDIPEQARALVAALSPVRWPRNKVHFPGRKREFQSGYNSISSDSLDSLVKSRLKEDQWRLNCQVVSIDADSVRLSSGETIAARGVIDARGPENTLPGLHLAWQKFVGLEFDSAVSDPECATIMDACLPQIDGYRFVYVLPLATDRVLVEDTYYSDGPELDVMNIAGRVREFARQRGITGPELRQETGVLPILIGGDPDRFWPANDKIARLGLRGAFFHPTTGYSLALALELATDLGGLGGSYDSKSLSHWSRQHFLRHWQRGSFFRLLNKMLFHAGRPEERYRIFEHFYRLPPDTIARFYNGQLTWRDRLRILSGKPPVPVLGAIRALMRPDL